MFFVFLNELHAAPWSRYFIYVHDTATQEQKEPVPGSLLSGRIMGLKCTGGRETPNTDTETKHMAPGEDLLHRTASLRGAF